MDIREFRDMLLRIDRPDEVLSLADMYLQDMEKKGSKFILPKEHAVVKPALEYFYKDMKGWLKFIKGVRDRLPKTGRAYHEGVNELYRVVDVRVTQTERRERISAAIEQALKNKLIEDTPSAKQAYANVCTQVWIERKNKLMKAERGMDKRLDRSVRDALLEDFWKQVDDEIQKGKVPKPR